MQQLEVLQYATSIYLNTGNYTIRLFNASQDMKKIITEFWKFRYNRLSMGMCASGYIFQAKVDELIGDIEGVKMYIGDMLVLSKYYLRNYIEQLIMIFGRLRVEGLKVNAPKCSLGLKEIPYL